jgi:hypothetical protein
MLATKHQDREEPRFVIEGSEISGFICEKRADLRPASVFFLDISWAYDNVIIDIICEVMVERELPINIIRLFLEPTEEEEISVLCRGY